MAAEAVTAPVAYLAGPTASGKSALAIRIAKAHGLAIVSADSMQVYRGMAIGTAQPSEAERDGVPHHLLGLADPREEFHAARFRTEALRAIAAEAAQGRRCLVVGGTGLWMRALREGLFDGPGRDAALRDELHALLAREGPAALHALLAREDPKTAARLSVADHVRVVRALEVIRATGRSITDWQAEDTARREALGPLPPMIVLSLEKGALHDRIARRVDAMMEAGWLDEARALHALALPEASPARKALGYPQLFAHFEGRLPLADAVSEIKLRTRQFARRQHVWFRAERGAELLDPEAAEARLRAAIA